MNCKKNIFLISLFLPIFASIVADESKEQSNSVDELAYLFEMIGDESRSFLITDTASLPTRGLNTAVFNNVLVQGSEYIKKDLVVEGTISSSSSNVVTGPTTSTPNAVAIFSDSSGKQITDSAVLIDSMGNVELEGITKNGNTLSWPSVVGGANTFLATDGAGNLFFGTPAGSGNVDTASAFTVDNRIVTTDFSSGAMNIQESGVTLDGSNNITGAASITATTFNGTLNGDATNFTGSLVGDVTGTQGATVVSTVGGQTAANVAAGAVLANNATSSNTASAIVRRDGSGNFSAGTITASLTGNVTGNVSGTAASATNFTGSLAGDVTGNQSTTVVATVGGATAANIATATAAANAATASNTPNTIVARDGSGDFAAGEITADLVGNVTGNVTGNLSGNATTATSATTATTATNFSGSLVGDVTGTQGATVVSMVGGKTAAAVASAVDVVAAATNTNTADTLVLRDSSGNFSAGTITANLTGNVTGDLTGNATTATSATTATNFTGSLVGDVTGTQGATVVSTVGGQTAANIAAGAVLANNATSSNTASAIVRRDGSGNFSAGTITANVTGNVTGNLTGNATTATSATTATTATNFSGSLAGDVTGTQGATVVSTVGAHTGAEVSSAVDTVLAATSNDMDNTLVLRNGSGDFSTNMITLNGTVTNPTDAATKSYVDNAVSSGFTVKEPARALADSNQTLSGTTTIDGVSVVANDRVLLIAQTNPVENGLWLVQVGAWTRPADFFTGDTAGTAYVLITEGTDYAGSSWVCTTPSAIIDTDAITFSNFSLPGQTTGANVGTGTGTIFRDKTGDTINFKSLANGTHVVLTNNTNDVTIATDATNSNSADTIVSRDSSGNFSAGTITASLTGSASNNVLKAGDTMTGNLNLATQSEIRWQDASGGEYVGFRAPSTVTSSYTISLPDTAPVAGQFIQATSATTTQWTTGGGAPSSTKTFYVSKAGSDSNDGSLGAPFLTVKKGITEANAVATLTNPITVQIGTGIFTEDNSGGPITVTADGVNIIGTSINGTTIVPSTLSINLFNTTSTSSFWSNFTLNAGAAGSTAAGISLTSNTAGNGGFNTIAILRFQTGLELTSAAGVPAIFVTNVLFAGNTTAISLSNIRSVIRNPVIAGPLAGSTPANTGITITGSTSIVGILSGSMQLLTTGVSISSGAQLRLLSTNFERSTNVVVASGASIVNIIACNFILNNSSSINVSASGASTLVTITGSNFRCNDASNVAQGTALKATTGATIMADSCSIQNAVVGIQCGAMGDSSTTVISANTLNLVGCTSDIIQRGTSSLGFIGGLYDPSKIMLENVANVSFAAFLSSSSGNNRLAIGNLSDVDQIVYEIETGESAVPTLSYDADFYGFKGTVYSNNSSAATFNATQAQNNEAHYIVVTQDRTQPTGVRLISDTSNVGNGDNVRGWDINKLATSASLDFNYSNNDTSGQAARGANSVMQLNGFDNIVAFPTAANAPLPTNTTAQLQWAGDTTLYRSASGTLKTDGNVIVDGLTANRALTSNGSKQLTSSAVTATELGFLSGTTSSVQTQIDGKVSKAGDTMTGSLQLPAGSTSAPSLNFTGGSTTGLSSSGNNLSLSTAGSERMKIGSAGTISINQFSSAGVVHNDSSGNLSSSQIVNADVSASAAIADTKLATISTAGKVANSATTATSANTASAIVARDGSGNFSAGTITASLTGSASNNVLKAGDTMTGTLVLPAGTAAAPSLQFTGSTNTGVSAATANRLSFDTSGSERMAISTTEISAVSRLVLLNLLCNQAIESVVPTVGGSISVASTTSILILRNVANVGGAGFTVTFPGSPTDGQFFTILCGTTNSVILVNNGNGASVVNPITTLNPGSNFTATTNGASVTYFYYATTNTWYRYGRG